MQFSLQDFQNNENFDLITKLLTDKLPQYEKEVNIPPGVWAGFDPAYVNDRSAFVILEKEHPSLDNPFPKLRLRTALNLNHLKPKQQIEEVVRLDQKYHFTKLVMDTTRDETMLNYLQDHFGYRIEGVKFTLPKKKTWISSLRYVFLEKLIELDPSHKNHNLIRKELYELDPQTMKHPDGGSDDFVWALALAISSTDIVTGPKVDVGYGNTVLKF